MSSQSDDTGTITAAEPRTRPDIATTMANVSLANSYRLEVTKQMLGMSAALFAFTIAFFRPEGPSTGAAPVGSAEKWLAWCGWALLGIAIAAGTAQLALWERFYISYRDWDNRYEAARGADVRTSITAWRRFCMALQYVTFGCGAVCTAVFAALRFAH